MSWSNGTTLLPLNIIETGRPNFQQIRLTLLSSWIFNENDFVLTINAGQPIILKRETLNGNVSLFKNPLLNS